MKQTIVFAVLAIALAAVFSGWAQPPVASPAKGEATISSFDVSNDTNSIPAGGINYEEADVKQIFELYENLSGRTLIRSPQVPTSIKITLRNARPFSAVEALRAMDDALAAHGIAMVQLGTLYVKAVPMAAANTEPTPVIELPWQQLPQSSSCLTCIVRLKHLQPEQATSLLQPFAKLPNSIVAMRDSQVIILRDFSGNVRRMLEVLEKVDQPSAKAGGAPQ
jgi:general secretion pathway protein D